MIAKFLVLLNAIIITKTKKRGKAQRVARLAQANATAHFLLTHRQAMLLPPSE